MDIDYSRPSMLRILGGCLHSRVPLEQSFQMVERRSIGQSAAKMVALLLFEKHTSITV